MSTIGQNFGTASALTAPAALANSATVGHQTEKVELKTLVAASDKPINVEFHVKLPMNSGAPANDRAIHAYFVPWFYDGSAYHPNDCGTATLPTGTAGAITIANPNALVPANDLPYTTSGMTCERTFRALDSFSILPDALSMVFINYSGVASISTGSAIYAKVDNFNAG